MFVTLTDVPVTELDVCLSKEGETAKTTSIRSIRLSASLGPNRRPPETPRISQHYHIEGFKGALSWSPIMLRDARLSNNYKSDRCCFFFSLEGRQGNVFARGVISIKYSFFGTATNVVTLANIDKKLV